MIALFTHYSEIKNNQMGCGCFAISEKVIAIAFACIEAAFLVFGIMGAAQTCGFSQDWGYAFLSCSLLCFSGEVALVNSLVAANHSQLIQPLAV